MKRWQKGAALLLAVCLMLALPLGAGAANETVEHAYALNELGLFQGMDSGFELDKRPTRLEGMTMFVRLLGGEEEALQKNYAHPFTDVPSWGDPYVGYAWEHGLTKGTGKGLFGSTSYITLEEYVTFVLRALDYSDTDGEDFTWKTSVDKAVETGLLTEEQASRFLGETTSRGTMVDVSYAALTQKFKGGEQTLAEKLVEERVFTRELAIQKGVWKGEAVVPTTSPKPAESTRPGKPSEPTETPKPSESPKPNESQKPEEPPEAADNYALVIEVEEGITGNNSVRLKALHADGEEKTVKAHKDSPAGTLTADYTVGDIITYTAVGGQAKITKAAQIDTTNKAAYDDSTKAFGMDGDLTRTTDDAVLFVQTEGKFKVYLMDYMKSFTARDMGVTVATDRDGNVVAGFANLGYKLNGNAREPVYGIVSACHGRIRVWDEDYNRYIVQSNGEEYEVYTNEAIAKGDLVQLEVTIDNIYNADNLCRIADISNKATVWIRESERDILSFFQSVTQSGDIYVGNDQTTMACEKDAPIIFVDTKNDKSECEGSIGSFDTVTGYANAIIIVDESHVIKAIFVEISNEENIDAGQPG